MLKCVSKSFFSILLHEENYRFINLFETHTLALILVVTMSSDSNGQASDLLLQIHKVGSSSSLAAQRLANFMVHQMGMANHIAATAASRWYLLLEIMPQIFVTLAVRFVLADCIGLEIFDVDTVSAFSNSAIFVSKSSGTLINLENERERERKKESAREEVSQSSP